MNVTFFGLFWGWLTVIMTVIYFVRSDVLKDVKTAIVGDKSFRLIYGMASVMIGLASVIVTNVWTMDWRGLTSLFGWLALLKGILTLAWPELAQRTPYKTRMISTRIALAVTFVMAVALLYVVYSSEA